MEDETILDIIVTDARADELNSAPLHNLKHSQPVKTVFESFHKEKNPWIE